MAKRHSMGKQQGQVHFSFQTVSNYVHEDMPQLREKKGARLHLIFTS